MYTQLDRNVYQPMVSYDRMSYVYNVMLTRLSEHHVLSLSKTTTRDPRIFELTWTSGNWSVLLSVKRVRNRDRMLIGDEEPDHGDDDPKFRYAFDDSMVARLTMFRTDDNFFHRNYLFERDYDLPEDFEQIITDVLMLVAS